MALIKSVKITEAVTDIFDAIKEFPLKSMSSPAVQSLQELTCKLLDLHNHQVSITVTGSDIGTLFTDALEPALGTDIKVGTLFKVATTADTADKALGSAKEIGLGSIGDTVIGGDDMNAFFIGNFKIGTGRDAEKGDVFVITNTVDISGTPFTDAKGSPIKIRDLFKVSKARAGEGEVKFVRTGEPEVDDVFVVTNIVTPTIEYVGTTLTFAGTQSKDFQSIGS